MQFISKHKILILWSTLLVLGYFYLGYFVTRDLEWPLVLGFGSLFLLYAGLFIPSFKKKLFQHKASFRYLLLLAIGLRGLLLFTTPNLSDDYFRFVWDGNGIVNGINPFESKPSEFVFEDNEHDDFLETEVLEGTSEIFPGGMNSKDYYSVYPPFNQLVFATSSFLAGDNLQLNVFCLRFFIFLFEIGTLLLLVALLKLFDLSKKKVFIYAFNPLVIVELIQNLHFEGMTLFFVFAAVYLLIKNKVVFSGLVYALAITTKLVPLLFLPLFLFKVPFKKLIVFYGVIGVSTLLFFTPFMGVNLVETFGSSIRLYFKTFEFNASIYYLLREIGYWNVGYNTIHVIGKYTSMVVLGSVLLLIAFNYKKKEFKQVFKLMVWALLIYYSLASIVHPWYVIYLLAFAVFTNYRFPIVWSCVVVLSYLAYRDIGLVQESFWVVFIEYSIVMIAVFSDLYRNKNTTLTV
jgi:hypothetical protein